MTTQPKPISDEDLVARLRFFSEMALPATGPATLLPKSRELLNEAADCIESQAVEIERLRGALERLGSSKKLDKSISVDRDLDELIARMDFARAALKQEVT